MQTERIREVLSKHGRLSSEITHLSEDCDLYNAGLTSLTTVGLMLALEDQFNVEFTDAMLSRRTFQSIRSIGEAISSLQS